jgi:hypothetical protein
MNYLQVLQDSIPLIRTNKFAVFYICISFGIFLLPSGWLFRDNIQLLCILNLVLWLMVTLLTIIHAGLVYRISQKLLRNCDISVQEGWSRGKSSVIRIFGLFFLLFVPVGLISLILLRLVFHRVLEPMSIEVIVLQIFLWPLTIFGLCAIVVDKVKIKEAISISFLIARNNLSRAIILSGLFILVQNILLVSLMLIIYISPFRPELSFPVDFRYATYQKILQVPIFNLSYQVITTLLQPWETAVFVIAYLNFTKETLYSALTQRQNAA